MVEVWLRTVQNLVDKCVNRENKGLAYFSRSVELCNLLSSIANVYCDDGSTAHPSIVSVTRNAKLDDTLNRVKDDALGLLNTMLGYLFRTRTPNTLINPPLVLFVNSYTTVFINSLFLLLALPSAECERLLFQDKCRRKLVVQILETLQIAVREREFYHLFADHKEHILANVVFPLMCTTPDERQKLAEDPAEFVNLGLDTCDKQRSHTVKTQAAKLLEGFTDHIDGAGAFTLYFCLLYTSDAADE